jgi:hypothetical protein
MDQKGRPNVHARTPVCTCVLASLSQQPIPQCPHHVDGCWPSARTNFTTCNGRYCRVVTGWVEEPFSPTPFIRTKEIARAPGVDPLGQIHRTGAGAVLLLAVGKMLERHIIDVQLALAGDAEFWTSGDLENPCWLAFPSCLEVG